MQIADNGTYIAGAVLVGTTSENSFSSANSIQINGSSGALVETRHNGTSGLRMGSSSDHGYLFDPRAVYMRFGTSDTERMRIASDGNVGIGTTSAGQKLEVAGVVSCTGFAANDNEIHLRSWSDPTHKLYYASGDIDVFEYNTKLEFRQYNGGGTRIVTMGITSGGTMTVSGDMVAYGSPSDINLKENIKPLEGALEKVMKLQGVSFTWKEDTDTNKVTGIKDDIGFIAQEVQEVVPDLVRKNDNGLLSLRDKGITALLVEAIKEQQTQIDELKYLLQNK
jgi:hypothetical protein